MKRPQFGLRDILWAMLFVALLFGWWVDRTRLARDLDAERQRRAAVETDLQTQAADAEKYKSDRVAYKDAYFRKTERSEPRVIRRPPGRPTSQSRQGTP